ncbi:amidohydrolase family protein [uncultured Holdemanella sp.]|uniref:metal-dependent hydrolase family protein n=1 Tax=uncultured Holdemanella sp. TaxID=1763549 RepID=UPI0025E4D7D2|nr:amidohydrolase family protein [uncultured Holdemanella sp.]
MNKLVIHAKIMIDGISDTPKKDQLITIEDDKITSIEDYHKTEDEVIEVNTITPGFFNCHVHILYPVGFDSKKEFSLIEKIFYAQKHCKEYLQSGVTFIRVVGTEENYDLQIKEAIENHVIEGPHMYCAGKMICMTGGHVWQEGIEADGKDACLKVVRTQLKAGVDLIKMMATGGVMTKGVEPGNAQFNIDEMKIMVEEAHKARRKTATHAQGLQGIKNALYAGVDSIEHGCFLDDECLELMKQQNTFLVPTLCAPQCIIDKGVENGVAKYAVDKTLKVKDAHVESVKKAYDKGIQIALGTDAGTPFNYHSNTAYEMELLSKLNIPNTDILKIATINSAKCVGVEKDYGSIEVGKQADLVCLNENPLENISNVRKINRVIQSGKIVVDNN